MNNDSEYQQIIGEFASRYKFHVYAMNNELKSWHIEKDGKRIMSNQNIQCCFAFMVGYSVAQEEKENG